MSVAIINFSINVLRSPIDGRNKVWSTELAKHLQFELVDTDGMTENQLKDIPYTVIDANPTRRKSKTNSLKVHKGSNSKDRVDRIRGFVLILNNF